MYVPRSVHMVGSLFAMFCLILYWLIWSISFYIYIYNRYIDRYKDMYIYTYIYTCTLICLLLLISMLWHRQTILKLKGDKLSSSAECRICTRGPRHQIASRLIARWQTDWAIEDQAIKLDLDSPSLWSARIQPTRKPMININNTKYNKTACIFHETYCK